MTDMNLLEEADRRGILPPEQKALLDEARRRGLTTQPQPAQQPNEPPELSTLGKIGRGIDDTIRSVASGMTFGFADEAAAAANTAIGSGSYDENLAAERQRDSEIPLGVKIPGEMLGMIGGTLATGGAGLGAKGAVAGGAAYGFGSGEGGLENRLQSAGIGAAGGAVGAALPTVASKVLKPAVAPAVKALRDIGVSPTVGQIMGGGARSIEEKAASIPLLGEVIKSGERRAVEQFNIGALNHSLSPIQKSLPKGLEAGRGAVARAGETISTQYDDVLSRMTGAADSTFTSELGNLTALSKNMLPERAKQFQGIMQDKLVRHFSANGSITGESLKTASSELGRLASKYRKSTDADQQLLGDALLEARQILHSMASRTNPNLAGTLKATDQAYSRFLRVEGAAAMGGAKEGVFSPAQLNSSVRRMDDSLRKRAFARGNATMQGLAESAESVLGAKVPNSGTADRGALVGAALTGGAGMVNPYAAVGIGAGSALYTRPVQNMMAELLTKRPASAAKLADLLRRGVPASGAAGSVGAEEFIPAGESGPMTVTVRPK